MIDKAKNQLLKQKVAEQSSNTNFIHHQWFVTFHLDIVERIALELCERHPEADKQFVIALVWLHDYEKIIEFDDQYNTELAATRKLMAEVGYSPEVIEAMATALNKYNARDELASARIEIQIVSSSDAASHLVGPFMTLHWYENSSKTIAELQTENARKIAADWDKKVTLPEIKEAFSQRHQHALEIAGILPSSYLR